MEEFLTVFVSRNEYKEIIATLNSIYYLNIVQELNIDYIEDKRYNKFFTLCYKKHRFSGNQMEIMLNYDYFLILTYFGLPMVDYRRLFEIETICNNNLDKERYRSIIVLNTGLRDNEFIDHLIHYYVPTTYFFEYSCNDKVPHHNLEFYDVILVRKSPGSEVKFTCYKNFMKF